MLSIFFLHVCGNLACVRIRHARYVACGIPEYENFRVGYFKITPVFF